MGDAVHPCRRLVGRDDRRGPQFGLDQGAGLVQGGLHPAKTVGNGAFGNGQPEHLPQHPRQPLEPDMMAVVQIGQQRPDAGAKRRAGHHPCRRGRPIALATAAAAPAEQFHPRHHRPDDGQVDMVIAMAAMLLRRCHRRIAMRALLGKPLIRPVRLRRQRPRHTRTRRPRLADLVLFIFPVRPAGAILRRRKMRIRRILSHLADKRFQLRDPCRHARDHRCLIKDQGVFLCVTQAANGGLVHPHVDSYSRGPRNRFCNHVSNYAPAALPIIMTVN